MGHGQEEGAWAAATPFLKRPKLLMPPPCSQWEHCALEVRTECRTRIASKRSSGLGLLGRHTLVGMVAAAPLQVVATTGMLGAQLQPYARARWLSACWLSLPHQGVSAGTWFPQTPPDTSEAQALPRIEQALEEFRAPDGA